MEKIKMPVQAREIIEKLRYAGHEAYIVGGCVRDSILEKDPADWDITTSASPVEIKELFPYTIDTGIEHGTVTVMIDHQPFEVTTYRVDGKYQDHRRPTQVHFTKSLKEDLLRRDFTINAMAYNDDDGLIDLYGGLADLKNGMIRCVGEAAQRFDEDALRILRALRFQAQLGFQVEEETKAAIRRQARFLKDISAERIQVELDKLLVSDHPEVLIDAYKLGVTEIVLPEFDIMMETPQSNPHHKYNVGMHTIEGLKQIEADHILRWTMLLHDVGKPEARVEGKEKDHFKMHPVIGEKIAEKVLRRLKFDNQTLRQVKTLVLWHDRRFGGVKEINIRTVRRWVSEIGPEMFEKLMKIQKADISAQSDYQREEKEAILSGTKQLFAKILEEQNCLSVKQLAVGGTDLIEAGVPQGKEVGEMLHWLLDQVLEKPSLNTKETLMGLVKEKRGNI
ncbi:MAG TPA: CCA tRNA nucleotidyltransferase [Candidatus Anaerostipes excrementavium]|uniref:CCA tRNA nucleotidyltransferase n=1 Tax=Candidatus Anaerostipes excrementavium TaxID=2838463 RepID=A0A9D1WVL6_9FIRM|nr:CCA tRNA nucleotidyltransferase [uncultured Anaerostipes sp.]HIX66860.1 CCA tRNA nucleotidyltransferase [Candidatus Anaerostipes excrementavium]